MFGHLGQRRLQLMVGSIWTSRVSKWKKVYCWQAGARGAAGRRGCSSPGRSTGWLLAVSVGLLPGSFAPNQMGWVVADIGILFIALRFRMLYWGYNICIYCIQYMGWNVYLYYYVYLFFTVLKGTCTLSKLHDTLKDIRNELKCQHIFRDVYYHCEVVRIA